MAGGGRVEHEGVPMSKDKAPEGEMRVDTDLIRQLADLLTEKDLTEIEVEDGDRRVSVKRSTMARDMAAAIGRASPPAPAAAARGTIAGFGALAYELALDAAARL